MSAGKPSTDLKSSSALHQLCRAKLSLTLVSAIVLFLSTPAFSKDHQHYLDRFFSLWDKQEISQAIDALFASNEKWYSTDESLQELKTRMQKLSREFGAYHGHEPLDVYDYGSRIRVITHLLFFEETPLRMEFIFFKPDKDWKIMHISFSDTLSEELLQDARQAISSRPQAK
ncbi:MAG: hypothetical protein ACOCPN_04700 [Desulfonatronovibrionaceae bacterium]